MTDLLEKRARRKHVPGEGASRPRTGPRAWGRRMRRRARRWDRRHGGLFRRAGFRWTLGIVIVLTALLGGAALPAVTAYEHLGVARARMLRAMDAARTFDLASVRTQLEAGRREVAQAMDNLARQPLRLVRSFPIAGDSVTAVEDIVRAIDMAVDGASLALEAAGALEVADGLSALVSSLDLEGISSRLARADDLFERARQTAAGADASWLPQKAATARVQLLEYLERMLEVSSKLAAGLGVLERTLGSDVERRVLVLLLNSAEETAAGGFPDQMAVFAARRGDLRLIAQYSDDPLPPNAGSHADYKRMVSFPHFPAVGERVAAFGRRVSGTPVDLVMAVDTRAVQALLRVAGGVRVRGRVIDGSNYVHVANEEIYRWYPTNDERQPFEDELTEAVILKVFEGGLDVAKLAPEMGRLVAGRHLAIWGADARDQAAFDALGAAGAHPSDADPVFAAVGQRHPDEWSKVMFFVRRSLSYSVSLRPDGRAHAKVGMTIDNQTPVHRLPDRVLGTLKGAVRSTTTITGAGRAEQRVEAVVPPGGSATKEVSGSYKTMPGIYRLRVVKQARMHDDHVEIAVTVPEGRRIVSVSEGFEIDGRTARWKGTLSADMSVEIRYG